MEYNTPMSISLGEQLRQIRESRGISLEEIAQKTRIRLSYLQAIESGDKETLPSKVQLRGFLRLYASELGVDISDLEYAEPDLPQELHVIPNSVNAEKDPINIESEAKEDEEFDAVLSTPEPAPDPQITEVSERLNQPDETFTEELLQTDKTNELNSTQTFKAIGNTLKKRRTLLSLSIEQISKNLHIRERYVSALEAGQFETLSSSVQARGMLQNYAEFLDLDSDSLLLKYADGLQKQRNEKQAQTPQSGKSPAKEFSQARLELRKFFSLDLLIITALFIAFALFVIWGVNRILRVDSPDMDATEIPEVADMLLSTGSATPQWTITPGQIEDAGPDNGTLEEPTPIFTPRLNNNPINIIIVPRQRVWVQVTADAELVFEGRMLPGNAYDFSSEDTMAVLTGNAGALQIYFNDDDIGSLGLFGQVVELIFTESGLVLPTPTNTPTITETPAATPTPTATPSSTFTVTPTAEDVND